MNAIRAIPDRLNFMVVVTVGASLLTLLCLAPALGGWRLAFAVVLFALLFQTNFSLFHEAGHLKLHSSRTWNRRLGAACGVLFGMSFSMFARTHFSHHLKNRTDQEMFDLYYPHQSRLRRAMAWYGMLVGLWYWVIPPANLLVLVAPGAARRLAERIRIADAVFRAEPRVLRRIRAELLAWASLMMFLGALVGAANLLLFYAAAGLLWSSVQYLEHAYAPRHVIDGAFNLRAPRWVSWLNLHRELDLNHHRNPDVSWIHLPSLSPAEPQRSYFRHYLSQWLGPRPTDTPGPPPLASLPDG
jgi:fatty acid desaturase